MDYKKFYNLEEYLFQDVGPRFRKTSTLSGIKGSGAFFILH